MFDRCHIVSPGDLREASAKLATITDPITAPKTALAGAPTWQNQPTAGWVNCRNIQESREFRTFR